MFFVLAICAILVAHVLGWDQVSAWMFHNGSSAVALQGALHAGLFLGLAGAALSFSDRPKPGGPLLAVGCLALIGLIAEDIMGVRAIGASGWTKDMIDLGQRAGLLVFFCSRFDPRAVRAFL